MNIIVCVKEIIDPELPADNFEIDSTMNIVRRLSSTPLVLNPFDEQAVEAALRIKDALSGKITILSLGKNLHREIVKKPLTMGADELILLEDDTFADGDSWLTAHALALAIKKIGDYDLILCGRQAADWDAGQVGSGIAEILGLPSVSIAKKIEMINGKARVERVTPDGYEIIEVALPALITISNELGQARYGTTQRILEAIKKQPTIWKPKDIGIDHSNSKLLGKRLKVLKLFQPVREGKCEIIEGETVEEAAVRLAQRLREAKIL
ncbi:MAG: electron transfer flavoprotein subunit beta/FixA family protein [Candidatus Hodarchaeota archaeon]